MARIRTIKPEFFTDEDIAALPMACRIAFQGLWCQADKAGRLEDRPARLKIQVLPYDDIDMEDVLSTLAEHRFIVRYEHAGRRLIQVRTFGKHQCPNKKEPESTIPAPCSSDASTILTDEGTCGMEGKGTERNGNGSPADADDLHDESFGQFWEVYPRKDAKQAAERAWRKLKPGPELVEAIVVAVERQARGWKDPQFIPMPATWLNGARWNDQGPKVRDGPRTVAGWRETCRARGHEEPCGTPQKCDLLHDRTQRGAA
jgi:hypothetical protein